MSCCEIDLNFTVSESNAINVSLPVSNTINNTPASPGSINVAISATNQVNIQQPTGIDNEISISTISLYDTKYIGIPGQDGSWRIRIDGDELVREKRIGGVWTFVSADMPPV